MKTDTRHIRVMIIVLVMGAGVVATSGVAAADWSWGIDTDNDGDYDQGDIETDENDEWEDDEDNEWQDDDEIIIEEDNDDDWVDEPRNKETIEDPEELEEATSGDTYRDYNHPVEDAVNFHWYDGDDWRVDAGPMACIDTSKAGGVTEVTTHANEYAEYVFDETNNDLWEEYSSESNFEAQIDKHYLGQFAFVVNPDETICNSVWENAVGTNDDAPNDLEEEEWDRP